MQVHNRKVFASYSAYGEKGNIPKKNKNTSAQMIYLGAL